MICYTLDDLYKLRSAPLSQAPLPESSALHSIQQQNAKANSRWGNNRRHDTPNIKPVKADLPTPAPEPPGLPEQPAAVAAPVEPPPAPVEATTNQNRTTNQDRAAVQDRAHDPAPAAARATPDRATQDRTTQGVMDRSSGPKAQEQRSPASPALKDAPPPGWQQPSYEWSANLYDEPVVDWDLPRVGDDTEDYVTLGDIRRAESTVEGMGVPLSDYIEAVKRERRGSERYAQRPTSPREAMPNNLHPVADSRLMPEGSGHVPPNPLRRGEDAGRQDIFFSESNQYGESRFMQIFERNKSQVGTRLNGNAKPFYPRLGVPSNMTTGGQDDPRKYAPFLQQRNDPMDVLNRPHPGPKQYTPDLYSHGDMSCNMATNNHINHMAGNHNMGGLGGGLVGSGLASGGLASGGLGGGLGGSGGSLSGGGLGHRFDSMSRFEPPGRFENGRFEPAHMPQQQQQQQHMPPQQGPKITTQQLVQIIQNISKNQSAADLSDRQRELLQLAAAKIKHLQQQQQQYNGIPPPSQQSAPQMQSQQHQLSSPQQLSSQQQLAQQQLTQQQLAQQQGGAVNNSHIDRVAVITDALQRTLRQQQAKGVQPTASQKQLISQVLQALQRLKEQRGQAAVPPPQAFRSKATNEAKENVEEGEL